MPDAMDHALEERIRARDTDALVVYLERKRGPLLAYIGQRLAAELRTRVDAEDVFQELVLAALQNLAQAAEPPREVFAWLCHLAEQRVIDAARHHRADKRDARREVSGHQPVPAETTVELLAMLSASLTSASMAAVRGERQARLEACLAELPETSREVLRLRYGEGLATREIAERLHRTDVSIRVLISRTVQELQKRLDENSQTR